MSAASSLFFSVLIIITIFGTLSPPLIAIAKATSCSSEYFSMIYAPRINYEGISEPDISPHGDIEFSDVIFSYPTRADVQVLKGFSARFQKGKTTALVGPSGSSKSTIVALLERPGSLSEEASTHSQQPTTQNRGSISIGGHDIADVRLRWWRSQIGLVQQEPFLFNDTIFNNICFGLKGTQRVQKEGKSSKGVSRSICRRGYQTKIGESGIKLSGGQRQRLAIARSIIRQPTILILDKATSSIDVRGERIVQKALEKVSKDLTTIVIAHRLSTIRKANHIIVIRNRRNMEEGTHNYLLSIPGGIYAGFVHTQQLEAECAPTTLTDEMASLQDLDRQNTTTSFKGQEDTTNVAKQMGFFISVGRLLYEQRAYWKLCVPVVLAAIGAGSSFPLQSWIFAQLVQVFTLTGERLKSRGDFWALMFFVLSLGISISYLCLRYFSNQFSVYVSTVYRRQYFKNLLQSPISWFDKEDNASGSLIARLATDCKLLAELIGFNGVFPLIAIFNIIGCTAVSFYFGWKLTLVVFCSALPVIIVASFVRLKLEREFEEWNAKVFSQSSQFATEAVGAFRTVISLTMEESIIHKYSELLQLQIREAFRKSAYACLVFALSDSIELCAMALTYWYGGQLLSTYEYNSLQFFVVYVAIVQGAQGAGQFFGFAPNIVAATSAANRILKSREIHDQLEMTLRREDELLQPENKFGAKIKFKDVAFRYPTREAPIYRNLNLNIGSGQFVAFVGPSGCGKTTVISLLERFYNPVSGTITLNDHNIQDIEIRSYRRALSLVAQEPKLFDGTIRDNLVLGLGSGGQSEPPTDDQIFEACISAEIHDFIVSLPEGYATILGINAQSSLSGGQKQRLCLARALLRSPSLLLLDEATSSLDSQSEKLVQQTIEKLVGERCITVIAVAHRLATIQKADIIFVFSESEAGKGSRILEQGTHRELLGQRGAYWAICQEQSLDR
ncbi:ABC transporter integral membrane type 1 [Penicillium freii]|nr:ABC transporter integral membrane type 1 [Penicillium freii]